MPSKRAAWLGSLYEAGGVAVRIGRRCAALDRLLAGRRAGFVTAWNPMSRRRPRGWNERMLARLREAARGRILAEGWGRGRGWAERHLLIAGDPRRLVVLARRFRQAAIVLVAPGRKARLRVVVARKAEGPDPRPAPAGRRPIRMAPSGDPPYRRAKVQ